MAEFTRRKLESVPPAIVAKWSFPVLDEGYIPFPKRLLRCLSSLFSDIKDLQVILAVADYRRQGPTRAPSYNFLAFTAGMEVAEFKARVEALAAAQKVVVTGIDDAITINIDPVLSEIERLTNEKPEEEVDIFAT